MNMRPRPNIGISRIRPAQSGGSAPDPGIFEHERWGPEKRPPISFMPKYPGGARNARGQSPPFSRTHPGTGEYACPRGIAWPGSKPDGPVTAFPPAVTVNISGNLDAQSVTHAGECDDAHADICPTPAMPEKRPHSARGLFAIIGDLAIAADLGQPFLHIL